ncbi:phage protein [Staphylococcus aureus]|nr:phage protein [Staphylococcus aureus]
MELYTTEKGTKLYYSTDYDLGGYNHFTGQNKARGYYLEVRRNAREFGAFEDLTQPTGAARMLLIEVTRKSKKQETNAASLALEKVEEIAQYYNL